MKSVNGGSGLAYDLVGQGPPLVLVHGFPADRRMWAGTARALSDRCRVITVDCPGFGESAPTDEIPSVELIADAVAALLDQLGIPMAMVGGLSMGGYVALAFAERHPARLSGLLLACTRATADSPAQRSAREEALRNAEQDLTGFLSGLPAKYLSPHADAALRAHVRELCNPRLEAVSWGLRAIRDRPDRTALLSRLDIPSLVIGGMEDPLIPVDDIRALHRPLKGAQLALLKGAGHIANLEAPAAFESAVRTFLEAL